MKKLFLTLFGTGLLFLSTREANAQIGPPCNAASPACASQGLSFGNSTGVPSLGTIGCLGSSPNPTFFFMEIAAPGNIDITINQTNTTGGGIDVDFALWGPFTSVSSGCNAITANPGGTIDCSFSAAATEYANIVGGQTGQIYILLLTNYSNQAGTISFVQTGGNGSTNCGILATASNNGPICELQTLQLFVDTPNTVGPWLFQWTGPNGFTSSLQNPTIPGATAAASGTYQVIVTNAITFESDTSLTNATVNLVPAAPGWTMPPVCLGQQFCLSPDPPLIPGATYNWTAQVGAGSLNSTAVPYCNIGTAQWNGVNMSLTVTVNGCTSPATAHPITLNQPPTMTITGPPQGCEGVPVTLTANPSGLDTYAWTPGGASTETIQATPGTIYTVTGTLNGCSGTSAPFNLGVIPNPLNVSGNAPFCSDTQIELRASPGKASYIWNGVTTTDSIYVVSASDAPQVTLQIVSVDGCVRNDTFDITVYNAPHAAYSPNTVCDGTLIQFNDETSLDSVEHSSGTGFLSSFFWDFGSSGSTSTDQNPSFQYPGPGTYNITYMVVTAEGCDDTIQKPFTVYKKPEANFVAIPYCFGQVQFSDTTAVGDTTLSTWLWTFSNGAENENVPVFDKTFTGTDNQVEVTLAVSDNHGCTDDTTMIVPITATPDFNKLANVITPGDGGLNDYIDLGPDGPIYDQCYDYSIQFFNRWGQKVYEITNSSQKFEGLNSSGGKLESGVYYYVIMADSKKRHSGTVTIFRAGS
ncbi:MAG: gliding motility-associated C-terminal domain-containing protein [Bacteroidia bacterium]|nr:gliding motility-associated C-terminal domain-containing protein [Bacteroidia bacterium]